MFSLNEAGQMNGTAGGARGGDGAGARQESGDCEEEEIPAVHEIGEGLMWTGR